MRDIIPSVSFRLSPSEKSTHRLFHASVGFAHFGEPSVLTFFFPPCKFLSRRPSRTDTSTFPFADRRTPPCPPSRAQSTNRSSPPPSRPIAYGRWSTRPSCRSFRPRRSLASACETWQSSPASTAVASRLSVTRFCTPALLFCRIFGLEGIWSRIRRT